MKAVLHTFLALLITCSTLAQTDLITNGSFENTTSAWTGWQSSLANGDLWAGQGSCPANTGTDYAWAGDQNQTSGVNDLAENMYQTVSIPSNATAVVLYFDASINTSETGSVAYDEMEITLRNTSGTVLTSLGGLNNTHGDNGISNCQSWGGYYANIPSSYWGQTVQVVFEFTTDGSYPTIFRIDDVELLVTTNNCSYALSTSSYTLNDHQAGTFSNIASVTAGTGCAWVANVTTGSSWLSTTSTGTGNGQVSITVTENTTGNARTGTIEVEGVTMSVIQPALVCEYTISPEIFTCPDYTSGTHSNIAILNTSDGCVWDADVLEGSSWLVTNSNGTGSGTINITVLENNSATPRSGSVIVEGETLLIEQPANPWLTGVSEMGDEGFHLFPNPASTVVNVSTVEWMDDATLQLMDLQGKLLRTVQVKRATTLVPIEDLAEGVYIIQYNDGMVIKRKKFVKTN